MTPGSFHYYFQVKDEERSLYHSPGVLYYLPEGVTPPKHIRSALIECILEKKF
ncbi:MAG: hypothetical protein MGG11_15090 [Trichodesmium sp. MAG_R03]|nr:hypothetical protein [Trichodesmium sp. MAG_R03]